MKGVGIGFIWEKVPGNPPIHEVTARARAHGLLVVHCGATVQIRNANGVWLQFMLYDATLLYRHMPPPPRPKPVAIQPSPTFRCERCGNVFPLRAQAATIRNGPHGYPLCLSCLESPGLLGALQAAGYQVTVNDS